MFLIFGFRDETLRLAAISLLCQVCGHRAAHIVYRLITRFTFFFVPAFRLSTHYRLQCTACGVAQIISQDLVTRYQQEAGVPVQA